MQMYAIAYICLCMYICNFVKYVVFYCYNNISMNFHIVTLFPESFTSYLNESILARAIKEKKVKVSFYNPRDFVKITKAE